MTRWTRLAMVGFLMVAGGAAVQADQCAATWATPLPPRADLERVAERNGLYVAVGAAGTIVTSSDRQRWTVVDSGTTADLHGVDWGEGVFVAVGDGVVLSSRDAATWTREAVAVSGELRDVEYGDGRFVAVGEGLGAAVLTSENGLAWTLAEAGFTSPVMAVASTGQDFLAAAGPPIYWSDDGIAWSLRGPVDPRVNDLVRVGLTWAGHQWVWAGGLELYTSSDGVEWSFHDVMEGCEPWSSLADAVAGAGRVLAVGVSVCPDPFLDADSVILTSGDEGQHWTLTGRERGEGFLSAVTGSRGYVAVGRGGDVMISTDGSSWTCPAASCSSAACSDDLHDVIGGDFGALAVGGFGQCDEAKRAASATVLVHRPDQAWQAHEVDSGRLLAVASDGTDFVAVGRGFVATSADGVSWDSRELAAAPVLRAVAFGLGEYAAVGDGGVILASSDGLAWVPLHSPTTADLRRVVAAGNRLVAVGVAGAVVSSEDGYFWSAHPSKLRDDLNDLAWDGARFLALGAGSRLWTSADLSQWARHDTGVPAVLTGLAVTDDLVVAVGRERGGAETARSWLVVSRDGRLWTRLPSQGRGLDRVAWTGSEVVAVGRDRTLVSLTCAPTLVTLSPPTLALAEGGSGELELAMEEAVTSAVAITLTSSRPDVLAVPAVVTLAPGELRATVSISVAGLAAEVVVTATLPAGLGAASATTLVAVEPPLPDPRRPSGRVGG